MTKISELAALTTLDDTSDELAIVDDSATITKRVTITTLNAGIAPTAAKTTIVDSGGYTSNSDVEAALQEIYKHTLTAQAFIPIPLLSVRETTNFDVSNIAANGGVLASDTGPVLEAINAATDGCQRISWIATNVDQVVFQTPMPPDLDSSSTNAHIVVHIRAAMSDTNNTPDITVDSFFNESDTKLVDTISAITGTSYAEYTGTIAEADIPDSGIQTLTVGLTPAAHANDALYITAIWIEYTRKLLTS